MTTILGTILNNFLIAFGVVLGASICAGVAAIFNEKPPLKSMFELAGWIKVWAVAIAIGGTFNSFEMIEKGIVKRELRIIVKQIACIISSMVGANIGYHIILLIGKCGEYWKK